MSAHTPTPGPWTVHQELRCIKILAGDDVILSQPRFAYSSLDRSIAEVMAGANFSPEDRESAVSANARQLANISFIAEAGTVHHETGLTPRHLADQRAELLALLCELIDIEGPCPGTNEWATKVRAAIAKATGGAA